MDTEQVPPIFSSEASRKACAAILANLPNVIIEEKKTSLHLVAGSGAFLGIHPRKDGVRLNVVLARKLDGPRIVKSEQVSKFRYHNELDFSGDTEIDPELLSWIREAYALRRG